MRSYEAARGYFSFLSFISWAAIIGGGILALVAISAAGSQPGALALLAGLPGALLAFAGFFGLIFVQSSRASVDSAEYAQQALQVARDQLAISQEMLTLARAKPATAGYTATDAPQNVSFDTDAPQTTGYAAAGAAQHAPADTAAAKSEALPNGSAQPALPDARHE
ncbi:MAG: hypothetical protein AAGA78_18815, partial [Pseudomonadota bacterium]